MGTSVREKIQTVNAADKLNIFREKISLLFKLNPFVLILYFFFVTSYTLILANFIIYPVLFWLTYMIAIGFLGLVLNLFYVFWSNKFTPFTWLLLYLFWIFLTGLGWGLAAFCLLNLSNQYVHIVMTSISIQILIILLMFFYSFRSIGIVFILPALPILYFPVFVSHLFSRPIIIFSIVFLGIFIGFFYHFNKLYNSYLQSKWKNKQLSLLIDQIIDNPAREIQIDQLAPILDEINEGIIIFDSEENIKYLNTKLLDLWSIYLNKSSKLKDFLRLVKPLLKYPDKFTAKLLEHDINPEKVKILEAELNNDKVFECIIRPYWQETMVKGFVWIFNDISFIRNIRNQFLYELNHDKNTGLPNKNLLYQSIDEAIIVAKKMNKKLMVVCVNLDNFKLINENFGHAFGDSILAEIGLRLKKIVPEAHTVATFHGDEFILLILTEKYKDLISILQRILEKIKAPIKNDIILTASLGVSSYPKDGQDAVTLLKSADMAMFLAKDKGKNNFKFFDETVNQNSKKRLEMEMELRKGIAREEFFLVFQPTFHLKTKEIMGVEALVRWRNPQKGIIYPANFIHLAEECGLIVELGEWIFKKACWQNKQWQNRGLKPISVSINISGAQLARDDFADMIIKSITEAEIAPEYIELELTESILMHNTSQTTTKLKKLKEFGLRLSVDDFGTGYSSLNYLHGFPINKLKIDQSFIRNALTNNKNAYIIQTIITMAHNLKLKVLAEGIETVDQLNLLTQWNCDEGQGFFFSHPLTDEAFEMFLSNPKF